jgi:hypothetical protein
MKNIRHKVFETNSSSTHSISIYDATHGLYDTIVPDSDGVITLTGGEFGWEWEKYNDALTKANYAAIFAAGDQQMTDMVVEVIKDHTGAKEVNLAINTTSIGPNWSYIDHQSARAEGGDAGKAFDTPKTLKNFIFHPESWLFTGNDNDSEPSNFYDVEFGIEYTHQLEKFQDEPTREQLEGAIGRLMNHHPIYARSYSDREKKFQFCSWVQKTVDGKKFSSFDKLDDGFILLFKTEAVYSKGKSTSYKGEKLLDQKEIKFTIKKF